MPEIPEILGGVKQAWQRVIYGTPPNSNTQGQNLFPLTERLSYLLKYADAVSVRDALDISQTPGYNIMAPYFGLKLLDTHPTEQRATLQGIVDAFASGQGYAGAATVVEQALRPNGRDTDLSLAPVSAKELSRVATWGPDVIDKRAAETLQMTRSNQETPVIIGYGGLLALKAAVDMSAVGQDFLLVLPKKAGTDQAGYRITREPTGMNVQTLSPQDFQTNAKIALVDDATHTGDTFRAVRQMFPQAQMRNVPLFVTT